MKDTMDRCLPHVNTQLGIPLFINILLSWTKGDRLTSTNSGFLDFEMISVSENSRLNKINSSCHWSMLCQKSLKMGTSAFLSIHTRHPSIHLPTPPCIHSLIDHTNVLSIYSMPTMWMSLLSCFSHVLVFATLWVVSCLCPWDSPA